MPRLDLPAAPWPAASEDQCRERGLKAMDYRTAGVDVVAGRAFVDRIRSSVEATRRPEVVGGLGGFGGLCRLPAGLKDPLLVSGTDGVGTKLELAQAHQSHHGVGLDLVAMCVNDVITTGAEPLFFLDYIATGKLSPEAMAAVVEGIAAGCSQSGCALLGGETAEMPGFYGPGRYDLAGFCVAVVEADALIDGARIQAGDRIVGIASSGVHSNGFSLVRRILEASGAGADTPLPGSDRALIDTLLTPTRLYGGPGEGLAGQRHPRARHGPHHRRRTARKPASLPAAGAPGEHRSPELATPGRVSLAAGGRRCAGGRPLEHLQPGGGVLPGGAA